MKSKMTAIFATLMIALMAVGFAYAHWSKIITIDGTVTTGTLHVTPSFNATLWAEGDDEGKQGLYDGVATIDWEVDVEENSVTIWLDNVYPCLWVKGYIDFNNTGTIPARLVDVRCEGNETLWLKPVDFGFEVYDGELLIANLYLEYEGDFQIDPTETEYLYFGLHFKEALPQGAEYWFKFEFEFWNWNEA